MPGFQTEMIAAARTNTDFRRVLFTAEHCQIVVMSLRPGEDIGREVHALDQVFFIVDGQGQAELGGRAQPVGPNQLVVVPAGTEHNIANTGDGVMKLYTMYAPPEHPDGTVHPTKADAEAAEHR